MSGHFILPRLIPCALGTVEIERVMQGQHTQGWRARLRHSGRNFAGRWQVQARRRYDALMALARHYGMSGDRMYPEAA